MAMACAFKISFALEPLRCNITERAKRETPKNRSGSNNKLHSKTLPRDAQLSTFNAAHYTTHWHGLIYIYNAHHHIVRSLRIQMSAPYTTPNSGTFLASAGVPTGASHDTTRRFSLSPPASCSETGAQRHAGSARTGACTPAPRSSTAASASLASARRWGDRPTAHTS